MPSASFTLLSLARTVMAVLRRLEVILQPAARERASDVCAEPSVGFACVTLTFIEMIVLEARYRYRLIRCVE